MTQSFTLEFEENLLARLIRDKKFSLTYQSYLTENHFDSEIYRTLWEVACEYHPKYPDLLTAEILNNEVKKKLEPLRGKDGEEIFKQRLELYSDLVDRLYGLDISNGEQYTGDAVIEFAQAQELKKLILNAADELGRMGKLHKGFSDDVKKAEEMGAKPSTSLFEQLIKCDDINENEVEKWVVEGIVPDGCLIVIYGRPGVGKTHIVYKMGNCRASGEDFFGRTTTKGPVYYLDYENPPFVRAHMKLICGGGQMDYLPLEVDKPTIDMDEFSQFEDWPRGLFIIDMWAMAIQKKMSLTGEDTVPILRKLKRLTTKGHTVIVLLHPLKGNDKIVKAPQEMIGHADHFLLVCEVDKPGEIEEKESEIDENPNRPKCLYFGCLPDLKSRGRKGFIWLTYDPRIDSPTRGLHLAQNPDLPKIKEMAELLRKMFNESGEKVPQKEWKANCENELGIKHNAFYRLVKKGEVTREWKGFGDEGKPKFYMPLGKIDP